MKSIWEQWQLQWMVCVYQLSIISTYYQLIMKQIKHSIQEICIHRFVTCIHIVLHTCTCRLKQMRHFSYSLHHVTLIIIGNLPLWPQQSHHLHHFESTMGSGTTGIFNFAIFCRPLKFLESYFPPFSFFATLLASLLFQNYTTHKIWCMNTIDHNIGISCKSLNWVI